MPSAAPWIGSAVLVAALLVSPQIRGEPAGGSATSSGVPAWAWPKTLVLGSPPGPYPMDRVDAARSGRAHDPLPTNPRVLARLRAPRGVISRSLAVTGTRIVLGAGPTLFDVGLDGSAPNERRGVLDGLIAFGPIERADGIRVVASVSLRTIVGWSARGTQIFHLENATAPANARLPPIALDDGSTAFVLGAEAIVVDQDGRIASRHHLPIRPAGSIVADDRSVFVTGDDGTVVSLTGGRLPVGVGSFGGNPGRGAALTDGHTLVAVIDRHRVVDLDVRSGVPRDRWVADGELLDGPVAVDATGTTWLTTSGGTLIGVRHDGSEVRRVHLGPPTTTASTAATPTADTPAAGPPVLVDSVRRVAFARAGVIGVVAADGVPVLVAGETCATPIDLAPAGEREMIVLCQDGTLLVLGER